MHAFLKGASTSNAANKDKATTSKPTRSEGPKPWVEKYRPKTVDEVAFQEEIVAVLKKSIERMDLPNLLFYGPPGTGKTSTILAAARELFGYDMYRSRVLELNASDERGIQVIRDKVKKFAQLSASGVKPDGKSCPPFKIIILDEADSMTSAAQAALRRTMEKECKTTRFCLICNYISRIIEPLTSRCSKFRFKPLDSTILKGRLEEICKQENIIYDEKAIDALIKSSEGDMRKAITYLQSVYRLKGSHAITENDVLEIAGIVPQSWIDGLISVCHSGSYEKLEAYVKSVMLQGHACNQIISQLHDILIESPEFTDSQKSIIFEKIAICDKRLQDGADEYLQLMDSGTVIMQQLCSNA